LPALVSTTAHGLKPAEYTAWDLNAISECDWLCAFLESSNPSGYALALEIGFAKACAKKILLVDEKSPTNEVLARHLAILLSRQSNRRPHCFKHETPRQET
jgi:hypothetical protein